MFISSATLSCKEYPAIGGRDNYDVIRLLWQYYDNSMRSTKGSSVVLPRLVVVQNLKRSSDDEKCRGTLSLTPFKRVISMITN